jgi:acyl-CoA synthetase (AMP-forming)/AMP-acid ligase II
MQSWIHVIEWRATVHPDVTALVDDRGASYSYAELKAAVESKAGGWASLGVLPGDVVAVIAKNSAAFLVHAFAIMRAGATPAFINWRLSAAEVADVLALTQPAAVAADTDFTALLDAAHRTPISEIRVSDSRVSDSRVSDSRVSDSRVSDSRVSDSRISDSTISENRKSGGVLGSRVVIGGGEIPGGWLDGAGLSGPAPPRPALSGNDVLALVHTSGTTGRAKAVPLRHGALLVSVAGFAIEIGDQVAGSRHLQILPLFHLGGFGQCMQALLTAGTVYVHSGFSPAAVIDAIERDRIEFFTAGPSLIDMLVAEIHRRPAPPDLASLKEIAYGTAPIIPSSLTAAIEAFGCRLRQIYGMTESQSMISLLPPEDHKPGHPRLASAGRVSFGWQVKVVDPADPSATPLPADAPGEVLIKGECLFSGYWRDPAATAAAFTADGWYRTGDVGRLTDDGYLYILDRAKDMVISGGENIYPAEVEAVLARHPAVAEVAVIGRPDPTWGEAVHAVIRLTDGADATGEEIIGWCRDRLAHFKCPKTVEFTGPLPRTTTGKVLKRELRHP